MYQLFPLCVNIGPLFEEPQALIEDPRHSVDSACLLELFPVIFNCSA